MCGCVVLKFFRFNLFIKSCEQLVEIYFHCKGFSITLNNVMAPENLWGKFSFSIRINFHLVGTVSRWSEYSCFINESYWFSSKTFHVKDDRNKGICTLSWLWKFQISWIIYFYGVWLYLIQYLFQVGGINNIKIELIRKGNVNIFHIDQ